MRKVLNIIVTAAISACFILLAVFVFGGSYMRLISAFRDFGLSVGFYFAELFGVEHGIVPTVNGMQGIILPQFNLPDTAEDFVQGFAGYFSLLFSADNFVRWMAHIAVAMGNFSRIILFVLPCIVLLFIGMKELYKRGNNNYGKDTLPLRIFKGVSRFTYQPLRSFIRGYAAFIRLHGWIWICWLVLWTANLNLVTIAVEFFAYYFYFAISFDVATLYTQFVKLIYDVVLPYRIFPWWLLSPIVI